MRSARVLIIMVAALALAACGSDKKNNDLQTPPPGTSTFLASGGTSTSGTGGTGGYVYLESYGGAVKVLRSGTVDASSGASASTPTSTPTFSFGSNHWIVSGGTTTVLVDDDPNDGYPHLYARSWDGNLYLGNGDGNAGNDDALTGLTIDSGATVVLADQGFGYATLRLTNDLVINGTLTADVNATWGLDIEANLIVVENGGLMTQSATVMDAQAGEIWLGSGSNMTGQIINHGTIEAKGLGTGSGGYMYFYANDLIVNSGTIAASGGSSADGSGGNANEIDIYLNSSNTGTFHNSGALLAKGGDSTDSNGGSGGTGGYIYIDVPDLVVNTGVIDVSGGNSDFGSGGSGGEFDVYVGYGDFQSSGTVRMNGGKGATSGGDTEPSWNSQNWYGYSAWIETAFNDNTRGRNGDIIISGTWEANGGEGSNGNGGVGGYIYLQTNAMGAVTINANMSAKGGNSTEAGFPGGNVEYGIEIYSYLDPYYTSGYNDPTTPGKIRIAGQFDLRGGNGDEMGGYGGYFYIYSGGYNASGTGSDVELAGFPSVVMNGGDGANGGSASGSAFQLYTYSPDGVMPAGSITNEANIEARGGNAAATAFSTGGSGGYVQMGISGIGDPAEVINNSGRIDISGGNGDNGGSSYMVYLWAQHVTNSGALMANGGSGITTGGSGGNITLNSLDMNTTNTGTLNVAGGAGATPLDSGSEGSVTIDTGGPL